MKKILFLLTILLFSSSSNGQLLWKVSGKDCHKPSYLFGTIHLETSKYIDSIPGLSSVINEVDAIYGEVLNETLLGDDALMSLFKECAAPADSTIDKLLNPEEYQLVDSVVRSYFGFAGIDVLKGLKPAMVTTQLDLLQMQKYFPECTDNNDLLDMAIQNRGIALGKHVDGLETVESQANALFGAPLTEQAQDLVDFCRKDKDFAVRGKRLCDAYHAQDLEAIEQIVFDQELGMREDNFERLSYKRNRAWMDKITMTLPVQSVLIAVGAAHLIGEQGLIKLLRDLGYTVEPVTLDPKQ